MPASLKAFLLEDRVPGAAARSRALAVALGFVALAAVVRMLLEQIVPALLPFVFTVPAVIGATLVAGSLAGWVALGGCQLLTLAFVLPHWIRDSGGRPQEAANLLLATLSLALAVWATAAYRASERRLRDRCERQVQTLSLLANEADHRTKNNFQIAAALLHAQGSSAEGPVREELNLAAGRLVSIAAIYGNLSARRPESGAVSLLRHLSEIAEGLRAGLLSPAIELTVSGDDPAVPGTTALTIGLVVNEWITNAVKYAFPDGAGVIRVQLVNQRDMLVIEVRDNGVGLSTHRTPGTGSRLIESLVEVIDGRSHVDSNGGTVCILTVPVKGGERRAAAG